MGEYAKITNYVQTTVTKDIHRAAISGNVGRIKELKQENANLNEKDEQGNTALHVAAKKGYKTICETLIKCGVEMEIKNKRNETAIEIALGAGHDDVATLLLDAGVNINKGGNGPPLLNAICYRRRGMVEKLIKHGADVNHDMDEYGTSALAYAINCESVTMVELLLKHKADTNKEDIYGLTPAYWAIQRNKKGILNMLLNEGAKINEQAEELLQRQKQFEMIEVILKRGIKLTIPNKWHFAEVMMKGAFPTLMKEMGKIGCHLSPKRKKPIALPIMLKANNI